MGISGVARGEGRLRIRRTEKTNGIDIDVIEDLSVEVILGIPGEFRVLFAEGLFECKIEQLDNCVGGGARRFVIAGKLGFPSIIYVVWRGT